MPGQYLASEAILMLKRTVRARLTRGSFDSSDLLLPLSVDAGPKKLELIDKYAIVTLDEDGFFDLIRTRPAGDVLV